MNWTALVIFLIYNLYLLGIEYGAAITGQRKKNAALINTWSNSNGSVYLWPWHS